MEVEAKQRIKKIVFFIILGLIFCYLALYIASNIINVYKTNREETDTISEKAFDCTTYAFEVLEDSVTYEDGKLSFKVRNTIGEPFDYLIVEIGSSSYKLMLRDFQSGSAPQQIILEEVQDEPTVAYPDGCPEIKKIVR